MVENITRTINIFYCYSHNDKELRTKLANHLGKSNIKQFYDQEIIPGTAWAKAIEDNMRSSHIILLLISSDFMASEYCSSKEMKIALEMHEKGEAYVIPIILRSVIFDDSPFSHLQFLPTTGVPITLWRDQDEALKEVALGIRRTINEALKKTLSK